MNLEDLSQHIKLEERIQQDEEILESLRDKAYPGAQSLDGMPHASGPNDKVGWLAAEIADLETEIDQLMAQSEVELENAKRYIKSIQDAKTRTVFSLRFVHCLTWAEVASNMGIFWTEDKCQRLVYRHFRKTDEDQERLRETERDQGRPVTISDDQWRTKEDEIG
jgi:DNA-directed RNA polymerase specialized sigma subunit